MEGAGVIIHASCAKNRRALNKVIAKISKGAERIKLSKRDFSFSSIGNNSGKRKHLVVPKKILWKCPSTLRNINRGKFLIEMELSMKAMELLSRNLEWLYLLSASISKE
ncbi:hypothetical protein CDAR_279821 [Caerostris darwini]|uniref:Uncharacterized protein n=1 Tax=Caerostris darwini TaxID=1538125 RepID=A0AAV4V3K2_9ARAC|nr:hypothetical protein CDAR_279821 [Caerostris darwini]